MRNYFRNNRAINRVKTLYNEITIHLWRLIHDFLLSLIDRNYKPLSLSLSRILERDNEFTT